MIQKLLGYSTTSSDIKKLLKDEREEPKPEQLTINRKCIGIQIKRVKDEQNVPENSKFDFLVIQGIAVSMSQFNSSII